MRYTRRNPTTLVASPTPELGKIGVVLTGGFIRGAFQAGALKAMREYGIIPSYVVGVSAGALNAAAFAIGRIEDLLTTYQEIAPNPSKFLYDWNLSALFHAFSRSESVLTNRPLRRLLNDRIDLEPLLTAPMKVDIVTTDFQTGAQVVFSNKNPEHQSVELLTDALLASAAMPIVFPPFIWRGHQLFDGGIVEKNPLSYAIREGCDTVFVILTDSQEHIRTSRLFNTIYLIARRAGNLISWRAAKKDLARGFEINGDIDSFERLKRDLALIVEGEVAEPDARTRIQEAVTKRFTEAAFSFTGKRSVRIFVVEPAPTEENESYTMFRLHHRSVQDYLEEGYGRMVETLKNPAGNSKS